MKNETKPSFHHFFNLFVLFYKMQMIKKILIL